MIEFNLIRLKKQEDVFEVIDTENNIICKLIVKFDKETMMYEHDTMDIFNKTIKCTEVKNKIYNEFRKQCLFAPKSKARSGL